MRRILPSGVVRSRPLRFGSSAEPPSPSPMYNRPSGPNATFPPLWLANGWSTFSTSRAGCGVEHAGGRVDRVLGDDGVARPVRVVDVREIVGRMEGEPEQALLAAAARSRSETSSTTSLDSSSTASTCPVCCDDEQPVVAAAGRDLDRLVELADLEQFDRRLDQRCGRRRWREPSARPCRSRCGAVGSGSDGRRASAERSAVTVGSVASTGGTVANVADGRVVGDRTIHRRSCRRSPPS